MADLEELRRAVGAGAAHPGRLFLGWAAGAALRRRVPRAGRPPGAGLPRTGVAGGPGGVRAAVRRAQPRSRAPASSAPSCGRAGCASGTRRRMPSVCSSFRWRPTSHDPARARDLTPFRVTGRTQQEVGPAWATTISGRPSPSSAIPAVVLHGEDDPIPIDAAETVAELLGAEFHPLPRCGHVPYVEAFEEFVRLMDGFLPRELGVGSSSLTPAPAPAPANFPHAPPHPIRSRLPPICRRTSSPESALRSTKPGTTPATATVS